jgi:alpha-glucosidase
MGAEYNKWGPAITATHNVTLPFTRMLLGPMDYTPGGFRSVTPDDFVARKDLPLVQTTRGQALAMYVVYESPFQAVADTPDAYKDQAGTDFLAVVPTSWDETCVIAGERRQSLLVVLHAAQINGSAAASGEMDID